MTKALASGTFDLVHPGHKFYLTEAKKHADSLVVVIARDATVKKVKGKKPLCNERLRLKAIKSLGIADKVILGSLGDKYARIRAEKPDVICLGYDQKAFVAGLRGKLKEFGLKTKVVRIKAFKPRVYKSSKLKMDCSMKNYIYDAMKKPSYGRVK